MAKTPDLTIEQFISLIQEKSDNNSARLLGIDLGTKTIGLAISNSNWTIVSPITTIRRQKFTTDVEELLAYATRKKIVGMVMGLPLNMDDTEGPRAQSTRAFVRNMARFCDLPVLFWDERLSSHAAQEQMYHMKLSMKKRTEKIDQMAATIILQDCLVQLRQERDRSPV